MNRYILSGLLAAAAFSAPAHAQDDTLSYGTIEYGILMPDPVEETYQSYDVPLAPGETVIGVYDAPAIIQMTAPVQDDQGIVYDTTPYVPEVDIDRVTGLPRNTPGWTGDVAGPAAVGCFPQGVCTHLN